MNDTYLKMNERFDVRCELLHKLGYVRETAKTDNCRLAESVSVFVRRQGAFSECIPACSVLGWSDDTFYDYYGLKQS